MNGPPCLSDSHPFVRHRQFLGKARFVPQRIKVDLAVQARAQALAPWLTALQVQKVRPSTQTAYLDSLDVLLRELRVSVLPRWEALRWDSLLPRFLEEWRSRGIGPEFASRTLAALAWASPHFGGPLKRALPASTAALSGWRRLQRFCSQAKRFEPLSASAADRPAFLSHLPRWDAPTVGTAAAAVEY